MRSFLAMCSLLLLFAITAAPAEASTLRSCSWTEDRSAVLCEEVSERRIEAKGFVEHLFGYGISPPHSGQLSSAISRGGSPELVSEVMVGLIPPTVSHTSVDISWDGERLNISEPVRKQYVHRSLALCMVLIMLITILSTLSGGSIGSWKVLFRPVSLAMILGTGIAVHGTGAEGAFAALLGSFAGGFIGILFLRVIDPPSGLASLAAIYGPIPAGVFAGFLAGEMVVTLGPGVLYEWGIFVAILAIVDLVLAYAVAKRRFHQQLAA
jgi:hypothetical protein